MVILLAVVNAAIVGGLVFGIRELIRLRSLVSLTSEQSRDPFSSTLAVLFSGEHGDPRIRRLQTRTVKVFWGVILLLFVSRHLIAQLLSSPHGTSQ